MNDQPESPNPDPRLERIRSGDRDALAEALEHCRPRLLRMIAFRMDRRAAGRIDPDDVLQEAFLGAAQRCEHLRGDEAGSLYIWLRLITLQSLTDLHRRHLGAQARDAGREARKAAGPAGGSTSLSIAAQLLGRMTSPTQAIRRVELTEQLQSALQQMNEIDREVLALRHFEELSNQEIAEVLNIEEKAASIRYVRALRRLKEVMTKLSMSSHGLF